MIKFRPAAVTVGLPGALEVWCRRKLVGYVEAGSRYERIYEGTRSTASVRFERITKWRYIMLPQAQVAALIEFGPDLISIHRDFRWETRRQAAQILCSFLGNIRQ